MSNTMNTPYNRDLVTPGIVHIGVGNFHRAHLAVYVDDLMSMGLAMDWGIVGAGVRPADAAMREALKAQGYLSTVIELDPSGKRARKIGSMIDFVEVSEGNAPLIAAMSRPEIRIVSLTVTEGGYFIDPATGRFDPDEAEIRHDAQNPSAPVTAFGAIVAALRNRRAAGYAPFTVMSCDNLPGNGQVTRSAVVGLAALSDRDLAGWIDAQVAFPNAMVDRITPATGDRERGIAAELGIEDRVPVTCEPFRQWVIEDRFPAGRPPFENVGVTFSDHVHAFEVMKIRILNGGHAIIAYPGGLKGIEFVHQAMADPNIRAFLERIETDEILPIVPPVPGQDLDAYKDLIVARFSNPEIADTERRLCLDGSNRQPKFIVPTIRDNLVQGRLPKGLILLSAFWCRYCYGEDENGQTIAPNDPNWAQLTALARAARVNPDAWIRMESVYGDLAENEDFRTTFHEALTAVWAQGVDGSIRQFLTA
ncbi:mannitol 2-dehydrogenase [Rhizobium aquaticum]|uniref:Mannitol 2-dehydrogenase n=1 Tax=Rhizobium aquaticum TaxID=1549636 RepID=A0ABV2J5L0_9HYPH